MISDKETNFVFFSNLFQQKAEKEFQQLQHWFEKFHIGYDFLPETKDIWVVDFMPVQVRENLFVQFKYDPDYLKNLKHQKTKSNPDLVCEKLNIQIAKNLIVLDGGNLVKTKNKVIITTKVFKDNPLYPENSLINEIKNLLEVQQVIVIPQEPKDFAGHADAMVRFIDDETVLVNKYPNTKTYQDFAYALRWSLRNAGLHFVEFPYDSWKNDDVNDATGCYINFLEVGNHIFFPVFAVHSDQLALIQLQKVFKDRILIDIDCRELAKLGGVLNCATWNIMKAK